MISKEDVRSFLASRTCAPGVDVEIIRCVDELGRISEVRADLPSLVKLQKVTDERQGVLVVQCLRAYEEHQRTGARALVAVYEWARGRAPALYPAVLHSEPDLTHAFARGKAVSARKAAADLYGDCFLVLAEFVATWNRRAIKAVS